MIKPLLKQLRKLLLPDRLFGYRKYLSGPEKGRALVCYLTRPFRLSANSPAWQAHQNYTSAICMARALNEIGYVVDIVSYNDDYFVPKRLYKLLIGMGTNFPNLCRRIDVHACKIYYATGAHATQAYCAAAEREEYFFQRHSKLISAGRRPHPLDAVAPEHANLVICIGNDWNRDTYAPLGKPVELIEEAHPRPGEMLNEPGSTQSQGFLYLMSSGAIHKGLDIALDAFASCPEAHLYIACMALPDNFREVYAETLKLPNIHLLGWLKKGSPEWRTTISRCAWQLCISCSEANCGSVITGMREGLVPIVTRECGVDVEPWGTLLQDYRVPAVMDAIRLHVIVSPEEIACRSRETRTYANRHFTQEKYVRRLREILAKYLP